VRREGNDAFLKAVGAAKPLSQFLFAELASHVDMATDEGRARFVSQAKPLLGQIEAPALGAMLRKRLAELARLSPEEVERLVPSRMPVRRPSPAPQRAARVVAAPAESRLLARVLARPDLAARVPDDVLGGTGAEAVALRAVVGYFREDPRRTLGQASAYFEASEYEPAINEALADPLLKQADSPDFDHAAEVNSDVDRLRNEQRTSRHRELLRRLEEGTATAQEQDEYRALQTWLASAKSGNPVPEARSKL
jgi:DNA primase